MIIVKSLSHVESWPDFVKTHTTNMTNATPTVSEQTAIEQPASPIEGEIMTVVSTPPPSERIPASFLSSVASLDSAFMTQTSDRIITDIQSLLNGILFSDCFHSRLARSQSGLPHQFTPEEVMAIRNRRFNTRLTLLRIQREVSRAIRGLQE